MDLLRTDTLLAPVHALGVLAQTGSFTQAARRLGLSKAAVSQRITELEKAVGVPLVRRTTRSVHLTEAGLRLVERTGDAWSRIEDALNVVHDLSTAPRGLVRVTAPVALGRQHLAPLLPAFLQQWPEIRIELDLSDALLNLTQEGFDLAVRPHQPPTGQPGGLAPVCLPHLAGGRSWARGAPRRTPAPLGPEHPPLPDLPAAGPGSVAFRADRDGGGPGAGARDGGRAGCTARQQQRGAARGHAGGLGLALLPDFSAGAALAAGRLQELLPGWRPLGFFGDAIYAMRPWSAQVPKAVQVLVSHLQQELGHGLVGG